MPHPLLQGSDINAVLKMSRGVGVAEFMEKPSATVRAFGAAIDLYTTFFQLVAHGTVTAVQFPAKRDRLKFF